MIEIAKSDFKIGEQTFKRTDNALTMYIADEYQRLYDATEAERRREYDNLGFFYGLEQKQWPDEVRDQMDAEGRHVATYNLSHRKVQGIAGSITRNPFDVKYVGDDVVLDNLTEALQQMYYSDKELMDWESEYFQGVVYGLIYRGVWTMQVETDMPASPLGNIAIRCRQPGTTLIDPDWRSTSSKKLHLVYHVGWLTAQQIKDTYKKKTPEIEAELTFQQVFGKDWESNQEIDWSENHETKYGSTYKVIEKHYLKREKVTREYDPVTKTVFWEWMSDEEKMDIAQRNNISSEDIKEIEIPDALISYTQTVCPSLSTNLVLEDRKDTFQIGRLHDFMWSATWINGKPLGVIDFLKDAQREVNYRQSTITLAAQAAINTGVQLDPAMFGNDERLIKEFEKNYGNPRQVGRIKAGMSRQFPDGIKPLARIQVAPDLYQIVGQMIDLMDMLVPQPAAGEARTERSGESGIHFAQKLEVMKTMQQPMMMGIKQLWNDIGEAYLYFAAQLYSHGIRRFASADGKTEFDINVPKIDLNTGQEYIENDFSQLSTMRHRIQISESPSGVNVRMMQRELNLGILSSWPKDSMPNTALTFAENIARSLDQTEEEKQNTDKALNMDRQLMESRTMAEITQNQAVIQQGQAAQGQQQGGGMPQGGGGQPMQAPPPEALGIQPNIESAIVDIPENYPGQGSGLSQL